MIRLYRRLRVLGYPKSFVQATVLPSWWDDAAAETEGGYAEALVLLSRHLGIDLDGLWNEDAALALNESVGCKFKKTKSVETSELSIARALGTQVAKLVALGAPAPVGLPGSAKEVRQEILDSGRPWVDLEGLVDLCWSRGVAVVPFSVLPTGAKKMDGFSARIDSRPVIVICRRDRFCARLLFILAHELGHLVLGHLHSNSALVDEAVRKNAEDDEEKAANRFALEVLTGSPEMRVLATGTWPSATQLAAEVKQLGKRLGIDPGHCALNYAHSMGSQFFPVGQAALKLLEPEGDAQGMLRRKLIERLDWSTLPQDGAEFLMRVTETDPALAA
jgi:hypothetical protein